MPEERHYRPDPTLWDWISLSDADSAEVARWVLEQRQHEPVHERPREGETKFRSALPGLISLMLGITDSGAVSALAL